MPAPRLTPAALGTAADTWHEVRLHIQPREPHDDPERIMATLVGLRLDQLTVSGGASCWWFMRKPPGWRIRLGDADVTAVANLLRELAADGTIAGWHPVIYEPETTAFGGPRGMAIAHELFCADTSGILDYLRRDPPPAGRRELSLLLISTMLAAAGLDWFERGDVFARVAAMRPAPLADSGTQKDMGRLAGQLRVLLAVRTPVGTPLFSSADPPTFAESWPAAFEQAGRRFGDHARNGILQRGLRAVLAHTVIFHWNRLGLPASTQAILARAATNACLPPE